MTLDAAWAAFQENKTGSLVPAKRADYVIWDRDIMRCEPSDILQAKVIMTVSPVLWILPSSTGFANDLDSTRSGSGWSAGLRKSRVDRF
jgi:hypothetical protein